MRSLGSFKSSNAEVDNQEAGLSCVRDGEGDSISGKNQETFFLEPVGQRAFKLQIICSKCAFDVLRSVADMFAIAVFSNYPGCKDTPKHFKICFYL